MKCALEILAMRELAEQNYAAEQARLDEECRIQHMGIIEDTFSYCENVIGPTFEKQALRRETPMYRLKGVIEKDRIGNKIFYPLTVESKKYANGENSYSPNHRSPLDVVSLHNYLKNYCFTVEFEESTYKQFGRGECNGYTMWVTIK